MQHLFYQKHSLTIAETYNELNAGQLADIALLLRKDLDPVFKFVSALKIISTANKIEFAMLPAEAIERFLPYAEWVFKENTLTDQLLPCYSGYYGPKAGLENMILKEFHACEMFYRMHLDKDPTALDKLVATLYRPGKKWYDKKQDPDGDIRQPLNEHTVDYHAYIIHRWPEKIKLAIMMYYDGCRQYLIKTFHEVFTTGGEPAGEEFMGMFELIRGIAADGKHGDFEKVEQMNVYKALMELTLVVRENKKAEEQLRK